MIPFRRAPWLAAVVPLLLLSCSSSPPPRAPASAAADRPLQWDHGWVRGAVVYEVFVRSFADSDGDGVGDLRGLVSHLDYLNDGDPKTGSDLGVDAIWLMPIFASPSYHGYDTTDYEAINPAYGTGEDFDRLIAEAHRRGIRVILDFVMNHTSDRHPWFVESASSPSSPRRDWYVWRADDPGWTQPWGGTNRTWHPKNGAFYYGVFWGGMPDLNFGNPDVRREIERLAGLWLARGVDGFRLDATQHLFAGGPGLLQNDQPETHAFLKEFAASVRRAKPQSILVGENWNETPIIAHYYGSPAVIRGGDELPMSFDFPLADRIVKGVRDGEASGILAKLDEVAAAYPPGALDAPFLTNHDMDRVATQLGGDPAKLRSAAAVLLTLPGTPFVYYGEEVGLRNGPPGGDEAKRTPMPWDASPGGGFTTGQPWHPFAPDRETASVGAQTGDPGSLLSWYRGLIRARHASAALREGSLRGLGPAGGGATPLLAFLREAGGEKVLVVHNLGTAEVTAGPYAPEASGLEPLLTSRDVSAAARGEGGWTIRMPAGSSGVWRLR
jgi:glycosidase